MKKLFLTLLMLAAMLSASANSVRYFTRPQAIRVTDALDAQTELMIYCGYEYELATYVIINQVWMEPVNSKYYEIWLFGYDAYTGEEIYMPIDLACIWLYNRSGSRIYSAAQYLRFRSSVATPAFYWTMPSYNSFTRLYHDPMFNKHYTYHYEIHRYGWRPPEHRGGIPPYHPYYMRTPGTPAPVPSKPFTPGRDYPVLPDGHRYVAPTTNSSASGIRNTSGMSNGGARTGSVSSNPGNPGTTNRTSASEPTGSTIRGAATTGSNSNASNVRSSSGSNVRSSSSNSSSSSTVRSSSTTRSSSGKTSNVRSSSSSNVRSSSSSLSSNKNSSSTTRTSSNTSSSSSSSTVRSSTNTSNSSSGSRGSSNVRSSSSSSNAVNVQPSQSVKSSSGVSSQSSSSSSNVRSTTRSSSTGSSSNSGTIRSSSGSNRR